MKIRRRINSLLTGMAWLLGAMATTFSGQLLANPFFATQTGQSCVACHNAGQEASGVQGLNQVGRDFRACGYKFGCSAPAAAPQPMAVMADPAILGEWDLRQIADGVVYPGRLSIAWTGSGYTGRIFFFALNTWELLENVSYANERIRFFRPKFPQRFSGRVNASGIEGRGEHAAGGSWQWSATRAGGSPLAAPMPPAMPAPAATLNAPVLQSPGSGETFSHFPRNLTLIWQPVSGAQRYGIEVQFCRSVNVDCNTVGDSITPNRRNIDGESYNLQFVGGQPGRWRAWAYDSNGTPGASSSWRHFAFTR